MRTLALGAIGVVFGDIGTSPLYTLQEVFSEKYGLHVAQASVFGVLSLVFWALMLVVTLKYVMFVMRADNKGEGGIMALLTLAQRGVRGMPRLRWLVALLAIFGAALFYGDGVITPAMTVLSAVKDWRLPSRHWGAGWSGSASRFCCCCSRCNAAAPPALARCSGR